MIMKKNILLFLFSASIVCGCSSESSLPQEDTLIRLRSTTLAGEVISRAPLGSTPGAESPFTALVPSAIPSGDGTNRGYVDGVHAVGTMTFSSDNAVGYNAASLGEEADMKEVFPLGNQVYMFGLYPGNKEVWKLTNTTASTMFTGKDDIMAAPQVLVKRSEVESNVYQTLAFSHLLTRLEVKLKAKTREAIASVGSIKSIRLVADGSGNGRIKDKVTFTPETNTAVFTESEALKALPFYKATVQDNTKSYSDLPYAEQQYELTISPVLQAYSMIAPVTADATNENEYYLAVERGDGSVDYVGFDLMESDDATPFTGSTAGYSFSVVLTYSKEYIEAVAAAVSGATGSQEWKDKPDIDLTD